MHPTVWPQNTPMSQTDRQDIQTTVWQYRVNFLQMVAQKSKSRSIRSTSKCKCWHQSIVIMCWSSVTFIKSAQHCTLPSTTWTFGVGCANRHCDSNRTQRFESDSRHTSSIKSLPLWLSLTVIFGWPASSPLVLPESILHTSSSQMLTSKTNGVANVTDKYSNTHNLNYSNLKHRNWHSGARLTNDLRTNLRHILQ